MNNQDTVRRNRQDFCIVSNKVIDDQRLSSYAKLTYLILCRYANTESGECFPAQTTIAKKSGISRRSVQRGLEELVEFQYLTVTPRKRLDGSEKYTSNLYLLTDFDETMRQEDTRSDETMRQTDARLGQKPCASGAQELNSSPREDMNQTTTLEVDASLRSAFMSKKRDAFWKKCGDVTTERGGHWAAGVKEASCLDKLVNWAKLEANGRHEEFLIDFLDGAWALHEGTVVGLREKDLDYWKRQPYTPSNLLLNAKSICSTLKSIAYENRELTPREREIATMGIR